MDVQNLKLKFDKPGRGRIYDSILETIGNTPMVRLGQMAEEAGCQAEVLAKLEFFNPISSVKDRIAVSMIEAMEAGGTIGPGSVIVEPTSGNTGIGLAFVCAAKGYRCILTMPDSFSIERRKLMKFFGAELALTPKAEGIGGAITKAKEIIAETPGAVMPWQFGHPANPEIHRRTTAEEIWRDTDGVVDAVILGVGTGGTLTGVAEVLKKIQTRCEDRRNRAGSKPDSFRRHAFAAYDSGHRGGFCARRVKHRYDRRSHACHQRRSYGNRSQGGSAGRYPRGYIFGCRACLRHPLRPTRGDEGPHSCNRVAK